MRAQQASVGYTRSGANKITEVRFSFTRLRMFDVPETAFKVNVAQELGLADPPTDPFSFGLPFFNVSNYSLVTDSPSAPQVQRDNLWHFSIGQSHTTGRHTWKFGFEMLRYQLNYLQSNLSRGQYNYSGVFTSADGSGVDSGDPFADFLLGFPQDTTRTQGSSQGYLRQSVPAAYIQDDWRVSRRLTLNLGLRYEYASPYTETRDRLLNLDYSTLPNPPRLVAVSSGSEPDRNNFAPRVGLAWQVAEGDRVPRGLRRLLQSRDRHRKLRPAAERPAQREQSRRRAIALPVLTTRNGFPKTADHRLPELFRTRPPRAHALRPAVERQCPARAARPHAARARVYRVQGDQARPLPAVQHARPRRDRREPPPRPGDLQALRTFPALGEIIQRQHIANSSYNSLQVKVERSVSTRLSVLASFVWSKSIDDADSPSSPACSKAPARRTSAISASSADSRSAIPGGASPPPTSTASPTRASPARAARLDPQRRP